jgi:hypothetical protein
MKAEIDADRTVRINKLIDLTEDIIRATLNRINSRGTFEDVEDLDPRGGVKTQRLSNVIGLNELRLLRSALLNEVGLQGTKLLPEESNHNQPGNFRLLELIQSGKVDHGTLTELGSKESA